MILSEHLHIIHNYPLLVSNSGPREYLYCLVALSYDTWLIYSSNFCYQIIF
jgi:hypothetical protein